MLSSKDFVLKDTQSVIDNNLIVDNIENTEILKSDIHGNGLFATKKILAGTMLAKLDGQIIDFDFYNKIKEHTPISKELLDYLFMEWNCIGKNTLLTRMFRTKYSLINHSRTPNLILLNNLAPEIWTTLDIEIGEELLLDYRKEKLPESYIKGHGSSYL